MAGLKKAKKYDWKDSNLALFGSDTERKVPIAPNTSTQSDMKFGVLFCNINI